MFFVANKRHASDFGDHQNMQQNNYQKRQKTGMNNMSGNMNQNQNMNNNRNFNRKEGSIELRILLPSKVILVLWWFYLKKRLHFLFI